MEFHASLFKPKQSYTRTQATMKALKARADAKRTVFEKFADWINLKIGSVGFLLFNVAIILLWILVNAGFFASFTPFDRFPFGLLTLILSVEAILLTIFVLIS